MKPKNSVWVVEFCTSTSVANWNPVLSFPETRGVYMTRKQARKAVVMMKEDDDECIISKYRVNKYCSLV